MAKNNYATKSDIKRLEKSNREGFKRLEKTTKTDVKGLENKFGDLKKDVLEMKVEVLGELKDMREENAAHNFSHARINDEIQEHEERIKKLETTSI